VTLAVVVGVAAAVGAVARYLVDVAVQARHDRVFPWGTLVVNVTGTFVFALVSGLATHHGLDVDVAVVLTTGFASGYTTWSTLMWESLTLARSGDMLAAGLNVAGSLVAGLLAAAAGFAIALLG
jgi:fluoride exporter